ncbi:MAG: FxsA family protein, partial [Solirubrobacteraceae bacterium]
VAIVLVANQIGIWLTLLLLILAWPVGIWALRSQGRNAMLRLSKAVAERRAPGREVLDGALIVIGGALMMIPGFITDVFGLICLLPPTRALIRGLLVRNLQSRILASAFRVAGTPVYDVDSTAQDVDDSSRRRLPQ